MGDKTTEELAFTDEGLRRMMRRAGVSSAAQKGPLEVNGAIRAFGDVMLDKIAEKCVIVADYLKVNTISDNILRQALGVLKVKPDFYVDPGEYDTFPRCESLREKTARRARSGGSRRPAKRGSTVEKEIRHEQKNDSCVYLEKGIFRPSLQALT